LLTLHHGAVDGMSLGIFFAELTAAYEARTHGKTPSFPPLAVSYADYNAWLAGWMRDSGTADQQLAFWKEQLKARRNGWTCPPTTPEPPAAPAGQACLRWNCPRPWAWP